LSIEALNHVWREEHTTTGYDRLVLLTLADYANARGESYPSVRRIASRANMAERSVQACLARLERAGVITRSINAAPDARIPGNRRPNLYVITGLGVSSEDIPDGVSSDNTPDLPGVSSAARRGVVSRAPGVSSDNTQTTIEPLEEPPGLETHAADAAADVVLPGLSGFDAFWSAYPRRDDKRRAQRAWETAIRRAPPEVIIEGAWRYAADPNRVPKFTKQPATWLNADAWLNGPLPSRGHEESAGMRLIRAAGTMNGGAHGNGADGRRAPGAALGALPRSTE